MPAEPPIILCPYCADPCCGNSGWKYNIGRDYRDHHVDSLIKRERDRKAAEIIVDIDICYLSWFANKYGERFLKENCRIHRDKYIEWYLGLPDLYKYKTDHDHVIEVLKGRLGEENLTNKAVKRYTRMIERLDEYRMQDALDFIWYTTHGLKLIDDSFYDCEKVITKVLLLETKFGESQANRTAFQAYYDAPNMFELNKLLRLLCNI